MIFVIFKKQKLKKKSFLYERKFVVRLEWILIFAIEAFYPDTIQGL